MWPMTRQQKGRNGERRPMTSAVIHWRMPVLMLVSLVGGTVLAIGHHAFYQSLHGTVVSDQSEQTWNIRIGTGFAFLVKLWLATSVSVACVQNLWLILYRKPLAVSTIDNLFDILHDAWSFLSLSSWVQGPVVVLLAAIAWCIPFSAVVTPSTLTVELSRDMAAKSDFIPMPSIKWANLTMAETEGAGFYNNPTADIRRITMSVGTTGSILNIAPPAPNATYSMSFYAPSMKCDKANKTVQDIVGSEWRDGISIFTGFVPTAGKNLTQTIIDSTTTSDNTVLSTALDDASDDHARIFLVAGDPPTAIECGFFNASYEVDFKFENGAQTLNMRNVTHLEGIARVSPTSFSLDDWEKVGTQYNYQSLMHSFGLMFVGSAWISAVGGTFQKGTSILWTSLFLADEIKAGTQSDGITVSDGFKNLAHGRNFTLAQGAEEIFRNMTLSIFSSPYYLQPLNETSSVKVSIFQPQNRYVYAPKYLWISYGLAIGSAIFGTLVGVFALFKNGSAFTNNFSTVLRVTRNPELATLLDADNTNGAEPVPYRLDDVKMVMSELPLNDGTRYWSMAVSRSSGADGNIEYGEIENQDSSQNLASKSPGTYSNPSAHA